MILGGIVPETDFNPYGVGVAVLTPGATAEEVVEAVRGAKKKSGLTDLRT